MVIQTPSKSDMLPGVPVTSTGPVLNSNDWPSTVNESPSKTISTPKGSKMMSVPASNSNLWPLISNHSPSSISMSVYAPSGPTGWLGRYGALDWVIWPMVSVGEENSRPSGTLSPLIELGPVPFVGGFG